MSSDICGSPAPGAGGLPEGRWQGHRRPVLRHRQRQGRQLQEGGKGTLQHKEFLSNF